MSYVKEITTNIKSPDKSSYTHILGKYTLLVGPNESGKSAIAEAVQLALTGSAYGLLYRSKPIKAGNQLSVLRPEGCDVVFAQAILDTGESAEWTLEEGKRPKRSGVMGYAIPMNEIRSVIAGSTATIRSFFYDSILGDTPRADIQAHLPEKFWEQFEGEMGDRESASATDLIRSLGKRKREMSGSAKAASMALKGLNPTVVTDAHISKLWLALAESQRLESLKELYRSYRAAGGTGEPDQRALTKIKASLAAIGPKEKIQGMITSDLAREELEEAYLNRGAYLAAFQIKTALDEAERSVASIGELEKALGEVVGKLLTEKNVWTSYAAKVNTFLPNADEFRVVDNGAVTLGLFRENGFHIALSGSTEARILAAMSAAFVLSMRGRDQDESKYPALIVVDDRMWDTSTLAKTMKALEKVDCQVIMMTTQKPRGKVREAWTYIELGK